jgi:hypothetical protein
MALACARTVASSLARRFGDGQAGGEARFIWAEYCWGTFT